MNGFLAGLNGEDIMLLILLIWILTDRKKENTEMLVGLGFLFYVGIKERNERGRLSGKCDENGLF